MEKIFYIKGNVPSSKNGKVKTRWGIVDSKAIKKWRKDTVEQWEKLRASFIEEALSTTTPVLFVHLTFIKSTKTLFDYFGPGETILDEMVNQSWINDDNVYQVVPVFGKFRVDKETAGVEIRILKEIPKYQFL